MAIVIAAPASGSGKTTLTLALLAALRRRGLAIQSFKVGPDYIDPMFHTAITGIPCRNLDPVLTSEAYVKRSFATHAQACDGAIVEGVMGLFDGRAGSDDLGSSAHMARLLGIPVVLVIDVSGMGQTVAAVIYGLAHHDPRLTIAGVILNRVGSERHAQIVRQAAASIGIPILGVVPRQEGLSLPSRHLGLVPVGELPAFEALTDRLAGLGETYLDWEHLLPLIQASTPTSDPLADTWGEPDPFRGLKIGIAYDQAFNFYYEDTFDLLRHLGAELIFVSPLAEDLNRLQVDGLILGGGFPEVFAAELSQRLSRTQLTMPLYAECGGLMVLGTDLQDFRGQRHPMLAILPHQTQMGSRLVLGYRQATAQRSTLAVQKGQIYWGHEFHHSQVRACPSLAPGLGPIFAWKNACPQGWSYEGWATDRIHASYLHLHWGGQPQVAHRFLATCQATATDLSLRS